MRETTTALMYKEQDGTDSAFLQDLCSTYALVIKVYTSKLWVYDREKYKAKDPVWTVYESRPVGNPTALCVEPGSFKWNTKLTGTYTGGLYTYTNKQKKSISTSRWARTNASLNLLER